ncbi:MAG: hypothetical protein PHY40_04350 [Patescibacteria group bacterium]|nr:hypothetical protein [Patescibacteria group bacterium]
MLKILKNIIIIVVCGFAVFDCVIANNPPAEVDAGVSEDTVICMNSQDVPNQKITLRFSWLAGTVVPKQGFVDACERLSMSNVICEESTTEESDISISAEYEYDGCVKNSDVEFEEDNKPSIIIFSNCIPEGTDKSAWIREVFTYQIGRLFGIVGIPDFCGEGNFNFAVGRGGFEGPYHTELTEDDITAWQYRLRGNSIFGPTGEYKICTPDAFSPICADAHTLHLQEIEIIKIKVSEELKSATIEGCEFLKVLGISCNIVDSESEEDIKISKVKTGPAGFAYYDTDSKKWIVEVRERSETETNIYKIIITHEILHTIGVQHYPSWCGQGIMEPQISNEMPTCLTLADYAAWQERR